MNSYLNDAYKAIEINSVLKDKHSLCITSFVNILSIQTGIHSTKPKQHDTVLMQVDQKAKRKTVEFLL